MINITIGSPPQAVKVFVDIQDDLLSLIVPNYPLYVLPGGEKYNCSDDDYCPLMGYYDPYKSATLVKAPEARGFDEVEIGDQRVVNVSMALFGFYPGTGECPTVGTQGQID